MSEIYYKSQFSWVLLSWLLLFFFYLSWVWTYSFVNWGQVVSRMCLITFSMELCDLFNRDLHVSVLVLVMLGAGIWGGGLLGWGRCAVGEAVLFPYLPPLLKFIYCWFFFLCVCGCVLFFLITGLSDWFVKRNLLFPALPPPLFFGLFSVRWLCVSDLVWYNVSLYFPVLELLNTFSFKLGSLRNDHLIHLFKMHKDTNLGQ